MIGELYYGANNSTRIQANTERIIELIDRVTLLDCSASTAAEYGRIKKELKDKGQPIPENDIWVAALSFEHNIELVSDDNHFTYIDNLKLVRW